MSSQDLSGALEIYLSLNFTIIRDPFIPKITYQNDTVDNASSTIPDSRSYGWSRFSHLFFHPDGDLCGVKDYFVKAPPPSSDKSLQWDWVTNAKVIGKRGWNDFKFLFFDPDGLKLYGVKDDHLYAGALPSNAQEQWLDHAKLVGASRWSSFDFLFFHPGGILYGVKNGKLHARSPPTDANDDWLGTSAIFGTKGWSTFSFLFFMSNGELYGVHQDNFYKGASPNHGMSSDEWLASSTLVSKTGWNNYKFLMSPLKGKANVKPEDQDSAMADQVPATDKDNQLKAMADQVPATDKDNQHERKEDREESLTGGGSQQPDQNSPYLKLLVDALGVAGRLIKDHTQANPKLSVAAGVAIALVTALVTNLYPNGSSNSISKPSDTPNLSVSAFPTMLAQGEKNPTNYDFGVRMNDQMQDCSSDTHWKKTFPDLDYSFLGYDILYGYPLANGRDPGFRHPIFRADYSSPKQTSDCRYVVPRGFTVVPSESCVVSFESKLVRNKQEMSEHLGVQANVEGGGWGFEFSASASYNKDTSEMSSGEFLYVLSHAQCHNYYSMVDFKNPPPFDPGFLSSAKKLADPKVSDEDVLEFIGYYGTHFFTDVTFGAKFVQKHKVSETAYQSLKKSKISVEVQASYSGLFSIGGGFSLDKEQSDAASKFAKNVTTSTFTVGSTPPANGDAMTWAASVQQNPVPMLYSLSEIDNLFTEQFAKDLPGIDYKVVREKLKNASQQHCQALKSKGTVHSCESKYHLEAAGIDISGPGYRHLREVDKPICVSFCLQDPNCTAVTHSSHHGHASSLCKFYSSVGENVHVHLNLTKQDGSNSINSSLVLFVSKLQDVYLYHAKLEGTPYFSQSKMDYDSCNSTCTEDLFCDAFSSSYAGSCSLFSTKDITNIVIEFESEVTFIGLHPN